jgi:hypothetical protein
MREAGRTPRWLWWLGIVLAGASLFAPGGRDLAASSGMRQHPLAAILYPTVGQDALVERPAVRVGEHAESRWPGRPAVVWAAAAALAMALLAATTVARRPARPPCDQRVPSGRRRGPPRPASMPRARFAPRLTPA